MPPLTPILKQNADIINGMMTIEIVNFDEIFEDESFCECTLRYKFNLPNDNKNYENNTWQSTEFSIFSLDEQNTFTLKVPLFLLPYSLEYNLNVKILDFAEDDGKLQNFSCIPSCNYTANIPSILIENTYNKNDKIVYSVPDAAYLMDGTILDLMENDMIKIKTNEGYGDDKLQDIVTLHKSKVYRLEIPNWNIVDITDRNQAEIDLFLRTEDTESIDIYCELSNTLNSLFVDDMGWMERSEEEYKNVESIKTLIAVNIHQFLYSSLYNYRIKCILDDKYLLFGEQWKYFLSINYNDDKKESVWEDPQEAINGNGSTCDICRSELNWYEYMFYCQRENGDGGGHAFCISCIHSFISQYYEMKPFIAESLNDRLDDNCIDEIVTFCVGKVIKFCNNEEKIDMTDSDEIEEDDVIDDTKCVGSKRSMQINNSHRKRRRLQ